MRSSKVRKGGNLKQTLSIQSKRLFHLAGYYSFMNAARYAFVSAVQITMHAALFHYLKAYSERLC